VINGQPEKSSSTTTGINSNQIKLEMDWITNLPDIRLSTLYQLLLLSSDKWSVRKIEQHHHGDQLKSN